MTLCIIIIDIVVSHGFLLQNSDDYRLHCVFYHADWLGLIFRLYDIFWKMNRIVVVLEVGLIMKHQVCEPRIPLGLFSASVQGEITEKIST